MGLEQAHGGPGRHPIGVMCTVASRTQSRIKKKYRVSRECKCRYLDPPAQTFSRSRSLSKSHHPCFSSLCATFTTIALQNSSKHQCSNRLIAAIDSIYFSARNHDDRIHTVLRRIPSILRRICHQTCRNTIKNAPRHCQPSLVHSCSSLQHFHAKRITHNPHHPTSRPSASSPRHPLTRHPP